MSDEFSPLAGFAGCARLFPLPNLVFFPQVMQPLHIFEPRYRQMTADALAGDRLIALALLRPGWEESYQQAPAIYSVATLGHVVADQKLEDGRYNILLRGLSRIQIAHEIPHSKLYRKAKVELVAEVPPPDPKTERRLRRVLTEKAPAWFGDQGAVLEQFGKLLESDLALGALCDLFAFALPLDVEFKQSLLEELEVEQRFHKLIEHQDARQAKEAAQADRKFPPEFSAN
ncbi:MAG: LON peptidase substrate-binding domain-containing protein [Gemmataceae bacterium]|nr:LON peptidase substrate-binding domain-containing protein [Gemmataceae bacterium]